MAPTCAPRGACDAAQPNPSRASARGARLDAIPRLDGRPRRRIALLPNPTRAVAPPPGLGPGRKSARLRAIRGRVKLRAAMCLILATSACSGGPSTDPPRSVAPSPSASASANARCEPRLGDELLLPREDRAMLEADGSAMLGDRMVVAGLLPSPDGATEEVVVRVLSARGELVGTPIVVARGVRRIATSVTARNVSPYAVAGGDRVAIIWAEDHRRGLDDRSGGSFRVRWLDPSGALSPEEAIGEPSPLAAVRFTARRDGVAMTWDRFVAEPTTTNDPRYHELQRSLLVAGSRSQPLPLARIHGELEPRRYDEASLPDGRSWVTYADGPRVWLIGLDASGEVASTHDRVVCADCANQPSAVAASVIVDSGSPVVAWVQANHLAPRGSVVALRGSADGALDGTPRHLGATSLG